MAKAAITKADMLYGARLKSARERASKTQQDVATLFKGSIQMVSGWERGASRPDLDKLPRLARFYDCSLEELLPRNGAMVSGMAEESAEFGHALPAPLELAGETFTAIGKYDVRLSAGPGSIVDAHCEPAGLYLAETQWLRALTLSAPEYLALVRVDGSSMVPTLQDGDWVLVDRTQTKVAREGIFAIAVQDVAWVKRISLNLRDRKIRIISDNTAIPVQDVEETDLRVIGRVLALVARRVS